MSDLDICTFCDGSGDDGDWYCRVCDGSGWADTEKMRMEWACSGSSTAPCFSCGYQPAYLCDCPPWAVSA